MIDILEITVDNYTPTPSSTPSLYRDEAPTPRPKSVLSQEALRDYALNKIFFHLLDLLEHQDAMQSEHPLVYYLRANFQGARIINISRKDAVVMITFPSNKVCADFKQLVEQNEVTAEMTDCLVNSLILTELGVKSIKIKVLLH